MGVLILNLPLLVFKPYRFIAASKPLKKRLMWNFPQQFSCLFHRSTIV